MFISMHSIHGWASFAWITASMRRGMEAISLWHCSGVMEAQVALIAAFRSSALLGLVSLIFLLTRFSMGYRSGEFAGQSTKVTPWSLNQLLVPLAVWAGAKSCRKKWNQHLHKACSRRKHEVLKHFLVDVCVDCGPSENTVDQNQQMTWHPKSSLTVENLHWTSSNMDSVPLHSSSRQLVSKWNATFTFIWKEDFGPLSKSPVLFLLSPVKMFLTMFLFQKWPGSSFFEKRGDSWCTDSSFSSLLVKLYQVFELA